VWVLYFSDPQKSVSELVTYVPSTPSCHLGPIFVPPITCFWPWKPQNVVFLEIMAFLENMEFYGFFLAFFIFFYFLENFVLLGTAKLHDRLYLT
jgi:hypothetical protein